MNESENNADDEEYYDERDEIIDLGADIEPFKMNDFKLSNKPETQKYGITES